MSTTVIHTARVTLTLEVDCTAPWPDDSQLGQVFRQAAREAMERVQRLVGEHAPTVRLVGEPRVAAISTVRP